MDENTKSTERVLIVEDNIINQMLTMHILTAAGYDCALATDGHQALKLIENEDFHLILMDMQMPVMDGYTTVKKIREKEALSGKHALIIALTAYAMKGDREKVIEAGVDYYMAKPFKEDELLHVIRQLQGHCTYPPLAEEVELAFNLDSFIQKFNHDVSFIKNLYENFIIITDDLVEKMHIGISNHDSLAVSVAAHSLKGSLCLMDARVGEIFSLRIESYAKAEKFVEARLALTKLTREIDKIKDQIELFLNTHSP